MKKVRINLVRGVKDKRFVVFNSPESLYVWLNDPDLQKENENKVDPTLGIPIVLRSGETMEVEWRGCEFIKDGSFEVRADYVRIGKQIKTKSSFSKNLIGIHYGWIADSTITFKTKAGEEIRTTLLTPKSKHKFNLDELFETYGKSDLEEPEIDLNNLS